MPFSTYIEPYSLNALILGIFKLWGDAVIALLLFCILLCLCKPLRTLVAGLFWILPFLVVWHWPSAA